MTKAETKDPACPSCGRMMRHEIAQMPMWMGSELKLISGVPARVCDNCDLQELAPDIETAIRKLVAQGFPDHRIRDRVIVPVFSLNDFREETSETLTIPEIAQ